MSKWTVLDQPFPKVSIAEPMPGATPEPVDNAENSVDQERALHKWVNDVRHWVQAGRAGSPEEIMSMLAAKGCPNPEAVVNAYHMTEGLQDMGLNEPGVPQQASPVEQPMAAPAIPQDAEPELGLPAQGNQPPDQPLTYQDQFGDDPQQGKSYEAFEDPDDEEADKAPSEDDEDEDDKPKDFYSSRNREIDSHMALSYLPDYKRPNNPYDPDNTPFGNRLIIGPGGQIKSPDQVRARPDKPSPDEQYQQAQANDEQYIAHLMQTRGISREEADAILTEHANGNVTAALKGSPYPENSEKNAPDHSAPGHHLPPKVNQIYNAIMREHPEYGKEKAMRIAWERSGETHEKDSMTTGTYNGVQGRIVARYEDVWGTEFAKFATEFGTYDVPVQNIQPAEAAPTAGPVEEIETFLGEIDPPGTTVDSIDARSDNLNQVVQAVASVMRDKTIGLATQQRLDEIALTARIELGELKEARKVAELQENAEYLQAQPAPQITPAGNQAYGPGGADHWLDQTHQDMMAEVEQQPFEQIIAEQPQLLVDDMETPMLRDEQAVQEFALSHIRHLTAGTKPDVEKAFVEAMDKARIEALANRKTVVAKTASTDTYDGPDEALFF